MCVFLLIFKGVTTLFCLGPLNPLLLRAAGLSIVLIALDTLLEPLGIRLIVSVSRVLPPDFLVGKFMVSGFSTAGSTSNISLSSPKRFCSFGLRGKGILQDFRIKKGSSPLGSAGTAGLYCTYSGRGGARAGLVQ